MTAPERTVEHVTCLGCGCACDDITVVVKRARITEARNACTLGSAWFGDGRVPAEIRRNGRKASLEQAIGGAAKILGEAKRPLVYIAADVSCETQRQAVAIADRLRATLDSLAATTAPGILAAQRRGRASATLGEIRQRADMLVFWGVDPAERYPRYSSRYAVDPRGLQAPAGRGSRTVIAVDVGNARGPADADDRVAVATDDEVEALAVMRAVIAGRMADEAARFRPVGDLGRRIAQGRYVVIVADAEPGAASQDGDRAEALVTLAQALNGPTRCALSVLRGGGNRSGADAVVTWQTGFPFAVDFAPGYPTYRPHLGATALLAAGEVDAALLIGSPGSVPDPVARALADVSTIAVGPRASTAAFHPAVAIDTGVAGIHEGGTAFRMDDVPLPLRPALAAPTLAVDVVRALHARLAT